MGLFSRPLRHIVTSNVETLFDFQLNPGTDFRVGPDINSPTKVTKQIFSLVDSNNDGKITIQDITNFMLVNPTKFTYLGLNLIFLP